VLKHLFELLDDVVRRWRRLSRDPAQFREQQQSLEAAVKILEESRTALADQNANTDSANAQLSHLARLLRRQDLLDSVAQQHLDDLLHVSRSREQILNATDWLIATLGTTSRLSRSGIVEGNSRSDEGTGAPVAAKTAGGKSKSSKSDPQSAESAFLWTTTEKLYQSWQFRLLGFMMLGAVAFALGGTFVIGGQTFRLHQNIEKAESDLKSSEEKIKTLTKEHIGELEKTQQNAKQQLTLLLNQTLALKDEIAQKVEQNLKGEFSKLIEQAKADEETFIKKQIELLQPARERIIGEINRVENETTAKADKVEREATIKIGKVEKEASDKIDDVQKRQQELKAALEWLTNPEKLRQVLNEIAAARTEATGAGERARGSAERAETALREVLAARPSRELSNAVAALDGKLTTLTRNMEAITNELKSYKKETDEKLAQIDCRLTSRDAPPSEAAMTADQKILVQQALTARGFTLGTSDGKFGRKTRAAIENFQTRSGAPSTRILSKEQIRLLLGLPESKCR
jgi:Putative peptidoglycan binding domain